MHKLRGSASAFWKKLNNLYYIFVFSVATQNPTVFKNFVVHHFKMAYFFLYQSNHFLNQICIFREAYNQRDCSGSGFLLTPSVIGKNVFYVFFNYVYPARVCGKF